MIGSRRKRYNQAVGAAGSGTPPNQAVRENLSGLDRLAIAWGNREILRQLAASGR